MHISYMDTLCNTESLMHFSENQDISGTLRCNAPAFYHKILAVPVGIRETVRTVPQQDHIVLSA